MMEDSDSDIDLNDLAKLMESAEGRETEKPSSSESKSQEFSSILDLLDNITDTIPSKEPSPSATNLDKAKKTSKVESSVIHSGDTDSEDDEEAKYFNQKQYNECGSSIKQLLKYQDRSQDSNFQTSVSGISKSWKNSLKPSPGTLCAPSTDIKQPVIDLNVDKLTGVRIVNPLVSSTVLSERLTGRKVVPFSTVKAFTSSGAVKEDWVIVGVIVSKSPPRTSAKGSTYSVIRLSDLRGVGDLKTVSVFLFSSACKTHGKNSVGNVLGILNPGVLDNSKSRGDEACLSVDSADKIMVLGNSKDFGMCKSKKKNGENCTSIVNKANCEHCIYHVKQEYQQCSRRSELQSSFTGKGLSGGLTGLRNKVLGKSEVFYGGQSFTAIPAKKNNKLASQDNQRLSILSGSSAPLKRVTPSRKRLASSVELSHRQAQKDVDRLRKLTGEDKSPTSPLNSLPNASLLGYSQVPKIEQTKNDTLAFISKAREAASSKTIISETQASEEEQDESKSPPKTSSNVANGFTPASKLQRLASDLPKKTTQMSRGAVFALAATQKDSGSAKLTQPSAFGLGSKKSVTSSVDGVSPSRKPLASFSFDSASPSGKQLDVSGSERNLSSFQGASPSGKLLNKSNGEKSQVFKTNSEKTKIVEEVHCGVKRPGFQKNLGGKNVVVKNVDQDPLFGKSPGEQKIITKLMESRGAKSAQPKVVEEKSAPTITKASEFGLGRGAGIRTKPNSSQVVPSLNSVPILGAGISRIGGIEFDLSVSPKVTQGAKLKALNYVRRNGSITKEDPNKLEMANKKKVAAGSRVQEPKKRKIADALVTEASRKKTKTLEEEKVKDKMAEFRALMEVTSKHANLVTVADNEAQEEYFGKLEKKEQLEEKMLNTYKVACKAVTCSLCKYTAFSAAEFCKEERHPLKVHDATKRFFKCGDCGNRTCCLEIIPLKTCSNCNSSKWERAPMMREKKVGIGAETLSIRGGEEKFIGSVVTGANLNLLVPDA